MHLVHPSPLACPKALADIIDVLTGRIVADGNVFGPFEQRIVRHLIDDLEILFTRLFKPRTGKQMVALQRFLLGLQRRVNEIADLLV